MDFSDLFNTGLTPDEEEVYRYWRLSLPENLRNTYDYDLKGAFKAGAGILGNGHMTDKFKKPNHPTFSDQSQYSSNDGLKGGHWYGGKYFDPSVLNQIMYSTDFLKNYFKQAEPVAKVLL